MKISKNFFRAILIALVLSVVGVGIVLACPPNGHQERNVGKPYCDGTNLVQNREALDSTWKYECVRWAWWGCLEKDWVEYWGDWYAIAPEVVKEDAPQCQPEPMRVSICHATASETNPYNLITINVNSAGVASGLNGHRGHGGDIIPTFSYAGVTYPGQGDQDILANGCVVPPPPPPVTLCNPETGEVATFPTDQLPGDPWTEDLSLCEEQPEMIQVCNIETGEIEEYPEGQVPEGPYTDDLSQCRKPPVTLTPPPRNYRITCAEGEYRAQLCYEDEGCFSNRPGFFNGEDWVCWAELCGPEGDIVKAFSLEEIASLGDRGYTDDRSACEATPVPPVKEEPQTGLFDWLESLLHDLMVLLGL